MSPTSTASSADFLKKADADLTVVIDRGGNVISQFGDVAVMDVTIIAALAAGSFAATRELARRIGEVEFNALYHQGNGSHIFMNSVDDDTIMITVFGRRTTVGSGALLFRGNGTFGGRAVEVTWQCIQPWIYLRSRRRDRGADFRRPVRDSRISIFD